MSWQIGLNIVGTVVGSAVGGPVGGMIGGQIGSAIGCAHGETMVVLPTAGQAVEGARTKDDE